MYSYAIAAITDYHKERSTPTHIYSLAACWSEVPAKCRWTNMQSAGRVAFPSGGPRGESVSCPSSFWRLPTRLSTQPPPPSSKPAMQHLTGPACHRPLWPQPGKFLHIKGCMDLMEGCDPWVTRDHLPISGSSILVTSAKGLLPCKVTFTNPRD